jgi:hypothetical protein
MNLSTIGNDLAICGYSNVNTINNIKYYLYVINMDNKLEQIITNEVIIVKSKI